MQCKLFSWTVYCTKQNQKRISSQTEAKHTAITMCTSLPIPLPYHFKYGTTHADPFWWQPTIYHKTWNTISINVTYQNIRVHMSFTCCILLDACPKNMTKSDTCVHKIMVFWYMGTVQFGRLWSLIFRNLLPLSSTKKNHSRSFTLRQGQHDSLHIGTSLSKYTVLH
jgi:hypothetical protein